jgi:hypothetical protein
MRRYLALLVVLVALFDYSLWQAVEASASSGKVKRAEAAQLCTLLPQAYDESTVGVKWSGWTCRPAKAWHGLDTVNVWVRLTKGRQSVWYWARVLLDGTPIEHRIGVTGPGDTGKGFRA